MLSLDLERQECSMFNSRTLSHTAKVINVHNLLISVSNLRIHFFKLQQQVPGSSKINVRTEMYGGPVWSKLNKIFCLLIELFVLAVYFILLYICIVTFCCAFFSLPSVNFWHTLQIILFTMY